MEFHCPDLRAFLSKNQCETLRARASGKVCGTRRNWKSGHAARGFAPKLGDRILLEPCRECPGVAARVDEPGVEAPRDLLREMAKRHPPADHP